MRRSYTSDIKLLICGVSLSGIMCLCLGGMLSWFVFAILAVVHVAVFSFFFDNDLDPSLFTLVALAAFAAEGVRIYFYGKDALLPSLRDLLVILAMARLVLEKTHREMYQIIGISLTECVLATVFTESPVFLLGVLVLVVLIPLTLYMLDTYAFGLEEAHADDVNWGVVTAGIVLIGTVLFYVIPRPSSVLLDYGILSTSRTGFSEDVKLESGSRTNVDRAVVMRIVWNSPSPPERFYLSGARLEGLAPDGFTRIEGTDMKIRNKGFSTDHLSIYPTGIDATNVFYPFRIEAVSPVDISVKGQNLYWIDRSPPVYEVWIERGFPLQGAPSVDVPEELEPVAALGREVAGSSTPGSSVSSITDYLLSNYVYSLDASVIPDGSSPVSWFVFNGKSGSCEHFASALAVMLRGCGIPARVVTGFLVDEFNTNGEYYIVRSSNAHAWVEYYDNGWITADATPAANVIPSKKTSMIDALRFRWIRWVIQYSLEDQLNFAGYAGVKIPELSKGAVEKWFFVLPFFIAFVFFISRKRKPAPYQGVIRALQSKGVEFGNEFSHENHLDAVREQWPSIYASFRHYQENYLRLRFSTARSVKALSEVMISRIKSTPR